MAEAKVIITEIKETGTYPSWAKAELTDRNGKTHVFQDKLPIFAYDDTDMTFPREGVIRCFIREVHEDHYVIDTQYPDDVESDGGETRFEVDRENVTPHFEYSCGMSLITEDDFIEEYKNYSESVIEYFLIKSSRPYDGIASHRNAALFAMEELSRSCEADCGYRLCYEPEIMRCALVSSEVFFGGKDFSHECEYLSAFADPPCGSHYGHEEFKRLNMLLFPNGTEDTEVYSWSDDWSDYFEDGREWWGCMYHTVYDKSTDRYIVIAASATD